MVCIEEARLVVMAGTDRQTRHNANVERLQRLLIVLGSVGNLRDSNNAVRSVFDIRREDILQKTLATFDARCTVCAGCDIVKRLQKSVCT
jgi:hypothetical protein